MKTILQIIGSALGIYDCESAYIDRLCENFDLDFGSDDIQDILWQVAQSGISSENFGHFGNVLIGFLFEQIKAKAVNKLTLDSDLFDWDCNGSGSDFYYDKQTISCWKDLEQISSIRRFVERNKDKKFHYGIYDFIPCGLFTDFGIKNEHDFVEICKHLKWDNEMGYFTQKQIDGHIQVWPYSWDEFYAIEEAKDSDVFWCVQRHRSYVPTSGSLQEFAINQQ